MEQQTSDNHIHTMSTNSEITRERRRRRERERRESMTLEERESHLARRRQQYHARRIAQTNEDSVTIQSANAAPQTDIQRNRAHIRYIERRDNMTTEERQQLLARRRQNYRDQHQPRVAPVLNTNTNNTTPVIQRSSTTASSNADPIPNDAATVGTCTLTRLPSNAFLSNANQSNFHQGSTSYEYVPNIQDDETEVPIFDAINENTNTTRPRNGASSSHLNIARNFTESTTTRQYRLPPPRTCQHCRAILFSGETLNFCCKEGNITLPEIPVPAELRDLFVNNSDEAKLFRKYIRHYNHVFSFTSLGVELDDSVNRGQGVYTFRAHGSVFHRIGSLLPVQGNWPRYIQMYIYDTDNETDYRMRENSQLNRGLIERIQAILRRYNPYVGTLRQLASRADISQCRLLLKDRPSSDRQYILPTTSEVAAIISGGDGPSAVTNRDIIVQTHGGHLHRLLEFSGYYDPLGYPLFLPRGTYGWSAEFRTFTNTKVSCADYYAYMLQIRPRNPSIFLYGGRLLHQYVVDNCVKIETQKLRYIRKHQDKLRAELYQGLQDCLNNGENDAGNVGRLTVLPSSFNGSPRDMYQRYQDAMAIVRTFGKPDLFITMTCNTNWIEIQEQLLPGQTPQDRPDLVTRIFRAKYEELKRDIYTRGVLGRMAAYVHVVEFQKRGLPHVHMLVILHDNHKLNNPDIYDHVVRAEIPIQEEEPLLYEAVMRHMIHGPCGVMNQNAPCMTTVGCKKKFPKQFAEFTSQGNDSYPIYRRRDDKRSIPLDRSGQKVVDNRWVIPYNPWLLLKYDCHINVEICSSVKSVKYLYKYVYKGPDCAALEVRSCQNLDEVQRYVDGRYICAPEAFWKIFKFPITRMYPSVERLQLHLPNMHQVRFDPQQRICDILSSDDLSRTMLTEFFRMHREGLTDRDYLYIEFPIYYRWIAKDKIWQRRVSSQKVIGRIYAASPNEGERFYLRLLLLHVRGPKSFQDLMTVRGVPHITFRQAAESLGLVHEDNSLRSCLIEARSSRMPKALRLLFATILIFCQPTGVRRLWDENYEYMIQDYPSATATNNNYATNRLLRDVNDILLQHGKSVADYDLPPIVGTFPHEELSSTLIQEELTISTSESDLNAVSHLNVGQRHAFNMIKQAILEKKSEVFFIDGPAGTGKTFLYRALLAHFRKDGHIMLASATSGIAANQLPGGRTAHSRFKIPIKLDSNSMCRFSKQSELCKLINRASAIIWDEAPMANRMAIETVDRTFRDMFNSDLPFGGKIMIFGGDFRQVVPVVVGGTRTQSLNASIKTSYLWLLFKVIQLSENVRARADDSFSNFVLRVGNGHEPPVQDDMIKVPSSMVIQWDDEGSVNKLIDSIFPDMHSHLCDPDYMMQRAIITPRNDEVDKLNSMIIASFPGENEISYYSQDSVEDDSHNLYLTEFLNSLSPGNLPPHVLTLKKGCQIMLLRNINPKAGLCNGTRLMCHTFGPNYIDAEILHGQSKGMRVLLPRIPLQTSEDAKLPFQMTRRQFPVRLSFAMTINKSQGQTIPHVGIYLPDHVFSHGQLYVSISRGVSQNTTKLLIRNGTLPDQEGTYTRNVVYPEILQP